MKYFYNYQLSVLNKKAERLYKMRQADNVTKADIQASVDAHLQLAKFFEKHRFNKIFPEARNYELENLRMAAALEDLNAVYRLSEELFKRGNFWRSLQNTLYANPMQEKYANQYYQEALVYVKTAEERGHILAKRLHGMAYIHGRGVPVDKDRGFKMVVDSIELANAWDKATQIFEHLGLNKPEFFSAIMSMRQKK